MVELERQVEGEDEIEQRGRMQQGRRHLAEKGHPAFGERIPQGEMAAAKLLGDEELDRIVEAPGVPIVELDPGVECGREEERQQREPEQGRGGTAESCARDGRSRRYCHERRQPDHDAAPTLAAPSGAREKLPAPGAPRY